MNKYVTVGFYTIFWFLFAVVGWIAARCYRERSLIRCCVLLTAVCCWLVWLVTFLMQLNPLIGPRVDQKLIYGMISYWKNSYIHNAPDP